MGHHKKKSFTFGDFQNSIGLSKGNLKIAGNNLKKIDNSLKPLAGSVLKAGKTGIGGVSKLFNSTTATGSNLMTDISNMGYPLLIGGGILFCYVVYSKNQASNQAMRAMPMFMQQR